MVPLDPEDEMPARDAEAALAFLVEQGMVEVAGDTITVPARFWTRRADSRPLTGWRTWNVQRSGNN